MNQNITAVINGGTTLEGVQRSRVKSIRLVFDAEVQLGHGAVRLFVRPNSTITRNGATNVNQSIGVTPEAIQVFPVDGGKTWDVQFAGAGLEAGSLQDGVYQLCIDWSKVYPVVATFHRLAGDIDGLNEDGFARVNTSDSGPFGLAFGKSAGQPGFQEAFDFNGDGVIDANDQWRFQQNFLTSLKY